MMRPAPHWITAERIKLTIALLAAIYPITLVGWGLMGGAAGDVPFGSDFITFWAASHLALLGEAAAAFDTARIVAAEISPFPPIRASFSGIIRRAFSSSSCRWPCCPISRRIFSGS